MLRATSVRPGCYMIRATAAEGERAGELLTALERDDVDGISRVLEQLEDTERLFYPDTLTAYAAYKHAEDDYPDVATAAADILDEPIDDGHDIDAPLMDQDLWYSDQRIQNLRSYVYEQDWCDPYTPPKKGLLSKLTGDE